MKQPKKYWAWTTRQRERQRIRLKFHDYRRHGQPSRWLRRHEWKRHRGYTRRALFAVLQGTNEGYVEFRYQHRFSAHWIAA